MTTQIYKLKTYKSTRDDPKIIVKGTYKEVVDALAEDKGYHQLLFDDINYNYFYDIDGINPEEDYIVNEFAEHLVELFEIDGDDIKYTKSIKDDTFSYHILVPKYNGTLKTQLYLATQLKEKFSFIDLTVYQNNRFIRLPNQTNKEKPNTHKIMSGHMCDFVLDLIQPNSLHTTIGNQTKQKKKHEPITEIKPTYATDEQIQQMLKLLPSEYLTDYTKWIIITNILKGQNKLEIWDDWSKQSTKYNKRKNYSIWRSTKKIIFDVSYLIKLTNFNLFKIYVPIIEQKEMKQMNHKYLYDTEYKEAQFKLSDYRTNKTIIIQSCTGTGKTTAVAEHTSQYITNTDYKVLSIISRITLGDQHIKSFNEKGIKMFSYNNGLVKNQHFIICINSLLMLKDLKDDEIKNYIVFIDEINSFIEHITHNETLHHELKNIYSLLMRIIKNAHKIIVADALISDNVFTLLKYHNTPLFIKNDFKKYEGVPAHRLKDENDFKTELGKRIKNNEPFFFGCDSCSIVEEYFYYFFEKATNKDKFVLFTANHKFNITNASEQFKDKFLFFSPAITTAVDFNIEDKQDVFIYIKGHTLQPSGSFQQTTRTRNIKELFYYSSKEPLEPKFNNLDEVKKLYGEMTITNDLLTNMSLYVDEDDNMKMSNNTFFSLFCYNEYVCDIYNTNKIAHYEEILKFNKFVLDVKGEKSKIDQELKAEMINLRAEVDENFFNDFLNSNNRNDEKYRVILDRIDLLNLPINDDDVLVKYINYIMNPHKLNLHLDVLRFFKDDFYIGCKLATHNDKNFKVKQFYDVYNKIVIFRNLQQQYNLSLNDINFENSESINISDDNWAHIKKLFRYTKEKPTTINEFKPIYIQIIKSITHSDIITATKARKGKELYYKYEFNKEFLSEHITLNQYANPLRYGYDSKFNDLLNIEAYKPIYNFNDSHLDEFIEN
jgi:hypothetical protein